MGLAFILPLALWLLVLLIPLWWLALAVPRRLSPARFWASLLVRTALLCTLVCALAGTQLVQRVDRLTTIFLIDSSDSITPAARSQAEAFVQAALKTMRPDDQAAVVMFGENALVERAPGEQTTLGRLSSVPVAARTNIQDALQLGMALLPADTEQRLVLLSDGGENAGQAHQAAELAAARGIPISYVDMSTPGNAGPEVLLSALDAPANVRAGEQFELAATVESSVAQSAQLRLFGDTQLLQERTVQLQAGVNRFTIPLTAAGQGFQRYRAQITPQLDFRKQNNEAATLVHVAGAPRVLLVEGQPGEGQNFKAALTAAQVDADLIAPADLPADLARLSDYDAVVLINVPAQALPVVAAANLPVYVRELGRGLVMVGGDHAYGIGGYGGTPIEQALPVYMDVRDHQERPDIALVFVIDKSGSMDACHCSGPNRQSSTIDNGPRKVDIAKDAMIQAATVLRDHDTVGVVAFDGSAHWVLPAQLRGPNSDEVRDAVTPIEPTGGTNVHAGLVAAENALQNVDARIKHVILLTDGWSGGGDNLDIATSMRAKGITLSVVAAGSGSADYLKQIADAGGGRYYPAQDMADVPQIFVQEIITTAGNYLVEGQFTPQYASPSPIMEQLEQGLPPLYGFNGTTLKQSAATILAGADDAPVLAQWQYGLGRTVAWTSDLKGKWAKDWVNWPAFPRFAAQMIGWTLPSGESAGVHTSVQTAGAQSIIDVRVTSADDKPLDGLQMRANVVGANGFAQALPLAQVAPGEYRASMTSPIQGTYIVQVAGAQDGRVVVQSAAGMVVPYSAEYRQGQGNPDLLAQLARSSGGTQLTQPADAFAHNLAAVASSQEIALPLLLLALLLLPIDIGLRRLHLRRSDFSAARIRLRAAPTSTNTLSSAPSQRNAGRSRQPARATDEEQIARLQAAKERARRAARGEED